MENTELSGKIRYGLYGQSFKDLYSIKLPSIGFSLTHLYAIFMPKVWDLPMKPSYSINLALGVLSSVNIQSNKCSEIF